MADEGAPKPKNRKERRLEAKQSGKPVEAPSTAPKLKLAQPERNLPKGKTLMDLYEEKKELLDQGQPFDKKYEDGLPRGESGNILDVGLGPNDEPIGPVGDAVFWATALTMFHFTLDVLVFNQYAQDIIWSSIFQRSAVVLPILFLMIYVLRSKTAKKVELGRQVLLFVVGTAAGCYLIEAGNRYDYFFVMKQAPPLGTFWVFCVIEMNLYFGLVSVLVDLGFLWWNGYSAF